VSPLRYSTRRRVPADAKPGARRPRCVESIYILLVRQQVVRLFELRAVHPLAYERLLIRFEIQLRSSSFLHLFRRD